MTFGKLSLRSGGVLRSSRNGRDYFVQDWQSAIRQYATVLPSSFNLFKFVAFEPIKEKRSTVTCFRDFSWIIQMINQASPKILGETNIENIFFKCRQCVTSGHFGNENSSVATEIFPTGGLRVKIFNFHSSISPIDDLRSAVCIS